MGQAKLQTINWQSQHKGNHLLQLRLFPLVFLIVVEGRLNGLVHMLGASDGVGAGEGPSPDILGNGVNSVVAPETNPTLPPELDCADCNGVVGEGCAVPYDCRSPARASSCRR